MLRISRSIMTGCSRFTASAQVSQLPALQWVVGTIATASFRAIRSANTFRALRASAERQATPPAFKKVAVLVDGFSATLGPKDQSFAGPNAEKVWPCYILDKHLAGLMDAFNLSDVKSARELVPHVFHGALSYIPERGHDRIGKKDPPYDETYVLPESLFRAYELTGDHALYDSAMAYLLNREYFDPLAAGENVLPGRHAYSHVIALSSAGKARLVLGDEKYLRAMKNAWELLATQQQYATGGWGPNETLIEPHKGQAIREPALNRGSFRNALWKLRSHQAGAISALRHR